MKLTNKLECFLFTGISRYIDRESAENTIDVVSTRLATHLDYVRKRLNKEDFDKYTNELLKNIIIYTACLMEGYWNSLSGKEKERGLEVAEEFIEKVKL